MPLANVKFIILAINKNWKSRKALNYLNILILMILTIFLAYLSNDIIILYTFNHF